ncbi:MAG TPA: PAS domain S-box protein, partial [Methanotrichaceae archaeon]|nr:PAS domain S-box protein [Methanotrichaceae archaeon]
MDSIFRAAIEGMSQAVCICDLRGQVQYINTAAARLTGYSPDLAVGRSWSDLFSEALGLEALRAVDAALASGNDRTFEIGGSRFALKISISFLRDGFKPAGIMISAQAVLEDKYKVLFDNSNESVFLTDLSGRIIEANDTAIKTLGFDRDEIREMGLVDLDVPECAHLEAARMEIVRRLGSILFETVLTRRDGSSLPVEVISRIIELEGEPAVLSSARAARSSWKMHYQLLQTIMDSIPSPLFFKDARGVYQGCNAAFERLLGMEKDRIIGKTAFEIYPGETAEEICVRDSDLLQHPGTQIYESHFQGPDGSRRDVIYSRATFSGISGRVAGLVGIIIDITGRKHSEREVVALKREMEFVLGATKTGLDIIDPEFNLRYIDPEWKKVYGEPGGRKCFEYFFGRGSTCPGCGVELALETKKVAVTEAVLS